MSSGELDAALAGPGTLVVVPRTRRGGPGLPRGDRPFLTNRVALPRPIAIFARLSAALGNDPPATTTRTMPVPSGKEGCEDGAAIDLLLASRRCWSGRRAGARRPDPCCITAEGAAKVRIDTLEPIESTLGLRQLRFVLAWAELHQAELLENWRRGRDGEKLNEIDPLQ